MLGGSGSKSNNSNNANNNNSNNNSIQSNSNSKFPPKLQYKKTNDDKNYKNSNKEKSSDEDVNYKKRERPEEGKEKNQSKARSNQYKRTKKDQESTVKSSNKILRDTIGLPQPRSSVLGSQLTTTTTTATRETVTQNPSLFNNPAIFFPLHNSNLSLATVADVDTRCSNLLQQSIDLLVQRGATTLESQLKITTTTTTTTTAPAVTIPHSNLFKKSTNISSLCGEGVSVDAPLTTTTTTPMFVAVDNDALKESCVVIMRNNELIKQILDSIKESLRFQSKLPEEVNVSDVFKQIDACQDYQSIIKACRTVMSLRTSLKAEVSQLVYQIYGLQNASNLSLQKKKLLDEVSQCLALYIGNEPVCQELSNMALTEAETALKSEQQSKLSVPSNRPL